MNRLVDILIEDETLNGAVYIQDNYYIIEFKVTSLKYIDKIIDMKLLHTIQNQTKFTYYDFYQVEKNFYQEYIILKFFSRKRINGIHSVQLEDESISSIVLSIKGVDSFFQDSSVDIIRTQNDKDEVQFNRCDIEVISEKLKLNINLEPNSTHSHSDYRIEPITFFKFDFKENIPYLDARVITDTVLHFFSFSSNRRYTPKIHSIKGIDTEFQIEIPNPIYDNPTGLFVPDSVMVKDLSILFEKIITADSKLRSVFKMFWDSATGTNESTASLYSKWLSTIELLYSLIVNLEISKDYPLTIKKLSNVIENSSELDVDQKNILGNRIIGLIDNPLRTKLVKMFELSDGFLFKINDTYLSKQSLFMNKIINTRNNFVHPNDKEKDIFSSIEVRKAITFFKCTSFILTCKYLEIDLDKFRGYYYEKVKYFFDLIDFKI